ncbi:MAG TPA: class II aldolase/adducin family protein [Oculatellaceae cyanobacterium]|jgi:ribulose-5-phosphate 4-epimerase/fuculose-1-phosphate aldolase
MMVFPLPFLSRFPKNMHRYQLDSPKPPIFEQIEADRLHRKQRLTAALRLFARFGLDDGIASTITARDPQLKDHFWVNPCGMSLRNIRVSDLILVNTEGKAIEGDKSPHPAIAIHSQIHIARPAVVAVVYAHSVYGKSWSSLGRMLDPITHESCAFYQDHSVFDDSTAVELESEQAKRIAKTLGEGKAVILRNQAMLTVGHSVDEAAWWFIAMERACQAQLLAEAAGNPVILAHDTARLTYHQVGTHLVGWSNFQSLYKMIVRLQPELLD